MHQSSPESLLSKQPQGFALVIALSLMAFILLLCLAMTTLVRVETQNSHAQSEILRARSNALLGLQVALGELQKTAGADQKVTGTADLLATLPNDAAGNAKRHWTGVWDVSSRDAFSPFTAPTEVNWLVSGKDEDGNDLTPTAAVEDPITLIEDATNLGNEVVAGLEKIVGSGNKTGHYAYWVGDEGVKAKINLSDPYHESSGTASSYYNFSQMTGQRTGIEKVTLSDTDSRKIGDYLTDPFDANTEEKLERINAMQQLPLLDSNLDTLIEGRIHEVTASSFGVLSDTAHGGLKKDLSLAFEMDLDDFNADEHFAAGGETLPTGAGIVSTDHFIQYLFTHDYTPNGDGIRGPTWHLLRNFYRLYLQSNPDNLVNYKTQHPDGVVKTGSQYTVQARPFFPQKPDGSVSASYHMGEALYDVMSGDKTSSGVLIDVNTANEYKNGNYYRIPRPTDMQINPVVTRMQLFLSLQAVKVYDDPVTDPANPTFTYRIVLFANPVVTIWNPYNTALTFDTFTVSWTQTSLPFHIFYKQPSSPPGDDSETSEITLASLSDADAMESNLSCNLKGMTLEPGQVKVFSHVTEDVESVVRTGGDGKKRVYMYASLEPYDGALVDENFYFSFDKIKKNSTTGAIEELLVEPNTDLSFQAGDDADYADKLFLDSSLRWGSSSINLSKGLFHSQEGTGDDRKFFWPPNGDLTRKVERVAEDYPPGRHALGGMQTDLKPRSAANITTPAQFLARYNPRAQSMTRFTGYFDNIEYPVVGNWSYTFNAFTNWNDADLAVDVTTANGYWGDDNTNGDSYVVLFELPTAPLQSLASLQHVNNISRYAQEPAYVIGNSYASPFIDRDQVTDVNTKTQVDWSYFCNEALWDGYFFSSLTPREDLSEDLETVLVDTLAGEPLPNSRIKFSGNASDIIRAELLDDDADSKVNANAYTKSAKHMMVDGAFNVNSTSVEAWKAVLSSANGIDMAYMEGSTRQKASAQDSPFSRMTLPSGDADEDWRGFRSLSDAEISALAEAIVAQVKLRGPFVSLADFVNRRLADDETGLVGPLQAAIDAASAINSDFSSLVLESDISSSNLPFPKHATGARAAAATGYLLQSDLLMTLGPVLNARSDTFTIRAYGDHEDVITGKKSTAICEAIVQRLPEYVDSDDDAALAPALASSVNQNFGRRIVIRSIRWLD